MDASTTKLARKYGLAPDIAQELVDAGYRNPASIERATKADLRKVRGVGSVTADKLKK